MLNRGERQKLLRIKQWIVSQKRARRLISEDPKLKAIIDIALKVAGKPDPTIRVEADIEWMVELIEREASKSDS